jgi:glyoxylase I family protein
MATPVFAIDHASVSVGDLDEAIEFYGVVIGFQQIPRPDFGFPGAWFRVGALAIHLTTGGHMQGPGTELRLNDPHIAIAVVDGFDELVDRLHTHDVEVVELENSPSALRQVFIGDPWGNVLEFCVNHPVDSAPFGTS